VGILNKLAYQIGKFCFQVQNWTQKVKPATGMNTPLGKAVKIRAFLAGMFIGLVAYVVFLKFLIADEVTATAIGWIFFAPQYFVIWVIPQLDLPETVGLVSCYSIIMLLYGYIVLSFRLSPKTAVGTFLSTALLFLVFVHWFDSLMHSPSVEKLTVIIFWPVYLLSETFDHAGVSSQFVRILIDCVSVAFWYAALICCVRTTFMPIGKSVTIGQPNEPPRPVGAVIVNCAKCNQQLRLPASPYAVQVRCPSCKYEFNVAPKG